MGFEVARLAAPRVALRRHPRQRRHPRHLELLAVRGMANTVARPPTTVQQTRHSARTARETGARIACRPSPRLPRQPPLQLAVTALAAVWPLASQIALPQFTRRAPRLVPPGALLFSCR